MQFERALVVAVVAAGRAKKTALALTLAVQSLLRNVCYCSSSSQANGELCRRCCAVLLLLLPQVILVFQL